MIVILPRILYASIILRMGGLYMDGIKDAAVPLRRVSPADGTHYYFGYYDNPAFDASGTRHLCNRAPFWDRLPRRDDACDLGVFDLRTGAWTALARTSAFNFQQGAMLQWNPQDEQEIIYNVREGGQYRCAVQNVGTGFRRTLPRAVANVSPDGRWGLCLNMNRVFDFRPGYGYSDVRDDWWDVPQPEDDGIIVQDMATGEGRLIMSYRQMGPLFGIAPDIKIVVNHITFSPGGERLLFLVRSFPQPGKRGWLTGLGTIHRSGEDFFLLNPMSMASHYHWRDECHLLIWATAGGETGMHLMRDETRETRVLSPAFFTKDIHCIYSPDRRYILGDGYPDGEGYRPIYLFDTHKGEGRLLLRALSSPAAEGDIRCDLHNRWSRDGKTISFDSTHEGFRGLYTADVSAAL